MKNGTVDVECGSTANTIARQQEVAYSVIFYAPQFKWIALKASDLKTTDDLKGSAVVVTQGTNTAQFVAKLNAEQRRQAGVVDGWRRHRRETAEAASFFNRAAVRSRQGVSCQNFAALTVDPIRARLARTRSTALRSSPECRQSMAA